MGIISSGGIGLRCSDAVQKVSQNAVVRAHVHIKHESHEQQNVEDGFDSTN